MERDQKSMIAMQKSGKRLSTGLRILQMSIIWKEVRDWKIC